MTKTVTCTCKDVPFGSYLESDLRTPQGVLILKSGTYVDEYVKVQLENYMGEITVTLDIADEVVQGTKVKEDNIVELEQDVKDRALQGVEYMYSNPTSADSVDAARETSSILLNSLNQNNGVNISINSLKVSDDYTFKHCVDVATMGMLVAKKVGMNDKDVQDIATAGLLHDLGKVEIPKEVLNKPGKLTNEEFDMIKKHPIYGYNFVKNNNKLSEGTKQGILMHHEKIDGTGYPLGVKTSKIHRFGRLLSVVDVYDALVTKRPYRDDMIEQATAIEMLLGMSPQFDVNFLNAFLGCVILYPIGTKVILSNGKVCEVVAQNKCYPLRPVVREIITNELFDLLHDTSCLNVTIVSHV